MTNTEDNLKKEIKEKWKEKWLIKKESKCWWEKMVDESVDRAKAETMKQVFEEINPLFILIEELGNIIYSKGNGKIELSFSKWETFCKKYKIVRQKLKDLEMKG